MKKRYNITALLTILPLWLATGLQAMEETCLLDRTKEDSLRATSETTRTGTDTKWGDRGFESTDPSTGGTSFSGATAATDAEYLAEFKGGQTISLEGIMDADTLSGMSAGEGIPIKSGGWAEMGADGDFTFTDAEPKVVVSKDDPLTDGDISNAMSDVDAAA